MTPKRVTILGGSIADGYGVERAYGQIAAAHFGAEYRRLTAPHRYIDWSTSHAPDIEWDGDWVVIQHGLSEGFWRPKPWVTHLLPSRMARPGGLDPGPFLASTPGRRRRQRRRWVGRALIRWTALMTGQSFRYMKPKAYGAELSWLVSFLQSHPGVERITLLGPTRINAFYFPMANRTVKRYSRETQRIAERNDLRMLKVSDLPADEYLADEVHPNQLGHVRIAEQLLELEFE